MNEKDKKMLLSLAVECGPIMQEGLNEALDALFDDEFPKTKKDIENLLSGDYKDLPEDLKDHFEAWVVFVLAKCVRTYKECEQ